MKCRSTVVEDEYGNYCSELAVEETSLEVTEINANESTVDFRLIVQSRVTQGV